jgi:hypothetical protein
MQQKLADAYEMASEFVDTYILAVQTWFEWTDGLQKFLFKILDEHSEAFSESAVKDTFEKRHRRWDPQQPGKADGDEGSSQANGDKDNSEE